MATLGIDPDKVCQIIVEARALNAREDVLEDEEEGSNPIDDEMLEVLEEPEGEDAVYEELKQFIEALNEEEQIELVALAWLGRGSFSIEEWEDAKAEAQRAHNDRTADYLLGMPMLADYLAEGLAAFGISCED
ncbi:hypothetical protein HRbin40_00075 [bacterium HR40]|nr:hypothetical protein HRbin40_00075 [bacterium HR40]